MSGNNIDTNSIVQISSLLSMIGSVLVSLSWYYPKENRVRGGRILLLWLSITDFLTALVYFMQTMNDGRYSDIYCTICALLGIYFPVASFIWTDSIAYFIYYVVATRFNVHRLSFPALLRIFHCLAWSIPLVLILIVLLFGHAGRDDTDDDVATGNTGGWCWISASSSKERFIWELIGGKIIEWVSTLIIVPTLYARVAWSLQNMEIQTVPNQSRHLESSNESRNSEYLDQQKPPDATVPEVDVARDRSSLRSDYAECADSSAHSMHHSITSSHDSILVPDGLQSDAMMNHLYSQSSGVPIAMQSPLAPQNTTQPQIKTSVDIGGTRQKRNRFTIFNAKLCIAPLLFLFIRFWGSLRVILKYAGGSEYRNSHQFLVVMQSFFDPSQGFFNALLFVLASKDDRAQLFQAFIYIYRRVQRFLIGGDGNELQAPLLSTAVISGSTAFKEENDADCEAQPRQTKLNSTSTDNLHLLGDCISEYECDSVGRLSNFSFDFITES